MPIIALPKTNLIADVPDPVMDRWKRPTVDNSDVMEGVGQLARSFRRPEADARAFAAKGLALAEIGEGISDVGQGLERVAEEMPRKRKAPAKKDAVPDPYHPEGAVGRAVRATGSVEGAAALKRQQARTAAQINDADDAMAAHDAQFGQFIQEHPNEDEWEPLAAAQRAEVISRLNDNPALTPEAREHIAQRTRLWDKSSGATVMMQATKATYARAKAGFDARMQQAIELQNPDLLQQTAQAGLELGVYTPEEWQAYADQFQRVGAKAQLEGRAQRYTDARQAVETLAGVHGPEAALAHVDAEHLADLDEGRKESLRLLARKTGLRRTTEDLEGLLSSAARGELASPDALRARYGDSPFVHPAALEEAVAALKDADNDEARREREHNGDRNFVLLLQKIRQYDPAKDPGYVQALRLRRESLARVGGEDDAYLRDALWSKVTGQPQPPRAARDVRGMLNDLLHSTFDPRRGIIPWESKQRLVDAKGQLVDTWEVDPRRRGLALQAQAQMKQQLAQWMAQAPGEEVTADSARRKFLELQPEGTHAMALASLQALQDEARQRRAQARRGRASGTGPAPGGNVLPLESTLGLPLALTPAEALRLPPGTKFYNGRKVLIA